MEDFIIEVTGFAASSGIHPSTVVQRAANVSGKIWAKWSTGESMPNIRTIDTIRAYMASEVKAAETVKEAAQ